MSAEFYKYATDKIKKEKQEKQVETLIYDLGKLVYVSETNYFKHA
jgi:hypothetical protein